MVLKYKKCVRGGIARPGHARQRGGGPARRVRRRRRYPAAHGACGDPYGHRRGTSGARICGAGVCAQRPCRKNGLTLSNGVGVIDSDYRGEISVGAGESSDKPYTVQNGERIAQLAVMPVALPDMLEVETLTDTERGTGGFGSTGRQ